MKSVWVLTREINEYNQDGEYFVAVYKNKPSPEVLGEEIGYEPTSQYVVNLLENGGGRLSDEDDVWWWLKEVGLG